MYASVIAWTSFSIRLAMSAHSALMFFAVPDALVVCLPLVEIGLGPVAGVKGYCRRRRDEEEDEAGLICGAVCRILVNVPAESGGSGYAGDLHAVPVALPDVLSGPLRAPPNGLALTVGKDLRQGGLPGHGPAKQCDVEGPHPLPVAFRLPEGRLVGCGHVVHGFVRLPIDRVVILSPPSVCVLDDDVQLAQLFRRLLVGDGCRVGRFG